MTDQTIPAGLTRDEAQAVREWAERSLTAQVQDATVVNVARVLLAVLPPSTTTAKETPDMPDQTLDDQVRPIVAAMRAAMRRDEHAYPEANFLADLSGYIKDLEALLPSPTLADMTEEERRECRLMQADVGGEETRPVIVNPFWEEGSARVMWPGGFLEETDWGEITPRPDLPRMEWPGTEKPAPVPALPDGWQLADHQKYGRVMVTTQTPGSDGNVFFVLPSDGPLGYDWFFCTPAELTYIDSPTTKGADQ